MMDKFILGVIWGCILTRVIDLIRFEIRKRKVKQYTVVCHTPDDLREEFRKLVDALSEEQEEQHPFLNKRFNVKK